MDHFLLMNVYAAVVAAFFSLLWRHGRRDRLRLFLQVYLGMVVGGLALAWLMVLMPSGPPTAP